VILRIFDASLQFAKARAIFDIEINYVELKCRGWNLNSQQAGDTANFFLSSQLLSLFSTRILGFVASTFPVLPHSIFKPSLKRAYSPVVFASRE
jgi:hypothetical protein